jgi:hypothetical protein
MADNLDREATLTAALSGEKNQKHLAMLTQLAAQAIMYATPRPSHIDFL